MIRRLEICESTNDEAARWARDGAAHGSVVVANAQTRGRGRLGRTWQSPPGDNLYFSIVLRPSLPPKDAAPITLAAGVAVAEALASFGITPELKWPNDVLVGGKKISGILSEMSTRGMKLEHVIVGVGLNVKSHPNDLLATSMRAVLVDRAAPRSADARAGEIDREVVRERVCAELLSWCDLFVAEGPTVIVDRWKTFANFLGKKVSVSAGVEKLSGIAEDLEPDGALRLRKDDGQTVRIVAGELQ